MLSIVDNMPILTNVIRNIQNRKNYHLRNNLQTKVSYIEWFIDICNAHGKPVPGINSIYQYDNYKIGFKWRYKTGGHLSLIVDLEHRYGDLHETIPGINALELIENYDLNSHIAWQNMAEVIIGRLNYTKKPIAKT